VSPKLQNTFLTSTISCPNKWGHYRKLNKGIILGYIIGNVVRYRKCRKRMSAPFDFVCSKPVEYSPALNCRSQSWKNLTSSGRPQAILDAHVWRIHADRDIWTKKNRNTCRIQRKSDDETRRGCDVLIFPPVFVGWLSGVDSKNCNAPRALRFLPSVLLYVRYGQLRLVCLRCYPLNPTAK